MLQRKAKILSNVKLTSDCWKLTLDGVPEICEQIEPGQFIGLRIADTMDPLFRRPFSVFKTPQLDQGQLGLEIVYRVVGRGTQKMTAFRSGDELDILGPCGTGYRIEENAEAHVLLGGGIGAACIYMLGERIIRKQGHNAHLHVLLGAETRESLILVDEFQKLKKETRVSTDDGSFGYRGMVTGLLVTLIEEGKIPKGSALYACGPEPMYQTLRAICSEHSLSAQVSIERHMACGMGVCLSCICKVRKEEVQKCRAISESHIQFTENDDLGYALSCLDGPVFNLEEVVLNE